jgi:hypothetical protein
MSGLRSPAQRHPTHSFHRICAFLPCSEGAFLLTSAKLGYLLKLETSVGALGFICFLTYQLHKGKFKVSKAVHLSTTVIIKCTIDATSYISGS